MYTRVQRLGAELQKVIGAQSTIALLTGTGVEINILSAEEEVGGGELRGWPSESELRRFACSAAWAESIGRSPTEV
jgi:hypothetical protein